MWSAFKSDLMDFVSTITEDTSKTLNQVIGDADNPEEEDEATIFERKLGDLRRSFHTYSNALEEPHAKEFDKFLKSKFSLVSYAKDIGEILDEEPDVSRYYAELVPISITPEEFWARFFFRVILLQRSDEVNLDDDDEEEDLVWESNDSKGSSESNQPAAASAKAGAAGNIDLDTHDILIAENKKLKSQLKTLVERISTLESELRARDQLITNLRNTAATSNCAVSVDDTIAHPTSPLSLESLAAAKSSSSRAGPEPEPEPEPVASSDSPSEDQRGGIGSSDDSSSVVLVDAGGASSSYASFSEIETPPASLHPDTNGDIAAEPPMDGNHPSVAKAKQAIASLDDDSDEEEPGWN